MQHRHFPPRPRHHKRNFPALRAADRTQRGANEQRAASTHTYTCAAFLQGTRCVLKPRLFTGALQWAMGKWRSKVESGDLGIDMHDGLPRLLDLRFADDIFTFGSTSLQCLELLDAFENVLDEVGLFLNVDKTVLLTNEARPPHFLKTRRQQRLQVKSGLSGHKMVGVHFLYGEQWAHEFRSNSPFASCFKNIFLSQTNSL